MGPLVKLLGGMLLAFGAVALGAPEDDRNIPEKQVFPLLHEEDQWWVGIADICEIFGAKFEGDGLISKVDKQDGLRIMIQAQFGGNGPFKITVGEDIYEFKLGELAIQKNGEDFGDFLLAPKRIEGTVAATLEDLSRILGFEVGEEVEGQPTIFKNGERYRLIQGERKTLLPQIFKLEGLNKLPLVPELFEWPIDPDRWREFIPEAPRAWKFRDVVSGGGTGYVEHNGMLYHHGGIDIGGELRGEPLEQEGETLYGPVVPGRYGAEGTSADLLYLSIIKRPSQPNLLVRTLPGPELRIPNGQWKEAFQREVRELGEAAERAIQQVEEKLQKSKDDKG
ncbi:MAG: hypothetical protein ACUVX8_08690 [Candidatus Zipacnadales bacterium]